MWKLVLIVLAFCATEAKAQCVLTYNGVVCPYQQQTPWGMAQQLNDRNYQRAERMRQERLQRQQQQMFERQMELQRQHELEMLRRQLQR